MNGNGCGSPPTRPRDRGPSALGPTNRLRLPTAPLQLFLFPSSSRGPPFSFDIVCTGFVLVVWCPGVVWRGCCTLAPLPTLTSLRAGAPFFSFLVSRRFVIVLVDTPNAFYFSVCPFFDTIIPYFQCPWSVTPALPIIR